MRIEELELTSRSLGALRRNKIYDVADLCKLTEQDLLEMELIGPMVVTDIQICLKLKGLWLGIKSNLGFNVGDKVMKISGDSEFVGEVRSVCTKIDGSIRILAESTAPGTRGWLLVFTEKQLQKI